MSQNKETAIIYVNHFITKWLCQISDNLLCSEENNSVLKTFKKNAFKTKNEIKDGDIKNDIS